MDAIPIWPLIAVVAFALIAGFLAMLSKVNKDKDRRRGRG
jgi:hypothetical protein